MLTDKITKIAIVLQETQHHHTETPWRIAVWQIAGWVLIIIHTQTCQGQYTECGENTFLPSVNTPNTSPDESLLVLRWITISCYCTFTLSLIVSFFTISPSKVKHLIRRERVSGKQKQDISNIVYLKHRGNSFPGPVQAQWIPPVSGPHN